MSKYLYLIATISLLVACADAASPPTPALAGDKDNFGKAEDQLFWTFEQKVAGYRNMEKISLARHVPTGDILYPLPRNETNLGGVTFTFADEQWTVDDYVQRQKVAGLIVVKDRSIVYERYELGNTETSRWLSYSVAKSVTSLLVGAALHDGYIESVDEKVTDYLPRLKNSSYDQSSIRNILQMASGVTWNEDYADPASDINMATWNTLELYEYLGNLPRSSPPGEVFNYNTAETNLVGTLLRAAIGNNLSTYLSEKIWKPFGMEHDAYWVLSEPGGGEFGGSSLNASLRDYARLGLFALRNGELPDGKKVLQDGWMAESIAPSKGNGSYGYLWWLQGGEAYAASGIFGQAIHIDPQENVVIALHSAREAASNRKDWALQSTMFAALIDAVSH
jgi:CubicO group peptidase (beta-lactamase class C family)